MSLMDEFLTAGMRVQLTEEARRRRKIGVEEAGATVLEPDRIRRYIPRIGSSRVFYEPGIYEVNDSIRVRFDEPKHAWSGSRSKGVQHLTEELEIHPDSKQEYENRYEALWNIPVLVEKSVERYDQKRMLSNTVRVGDLPLTKVWEMDQVKLNPDGDGSSPDYLNRLTHVITRIDYYDDGKHRFHVDALNTDGKRTMSLVLNEEEFELSQRGNLWRFYNNETVEFESLYEEMKFHFALGQIEEVRNPATDTFRWSAHCMKTGVMDGDIDFAWTSSDDLRFPIEGHCYRFKDRELGERVRQEVLKVNNESPAQESSISYRP